MLSWGAKGTGATGHRLGTGSYDDPDEDAYLEPKPVRDLVGEEVCQVTISALSCKLLPEVWACHTPTPGFFCCIQLYACVGRVTPLNERRM